MSLPFPQIEAPASCGACRDGHGLGFELTMAFQPIVDAARREVFAYEALVRGTDGASAYDVLSRVTEENRYAFDQRCRVKAIELAARLGIAERGAKLSINFMPGAVYSPAACIRQTLAAAREHTFPLDAMIFEITENEKVETDHLRRIAAEYARHGFTLALDDFGAGYSGLNLLAGLDGVGLVKVDGALIRGIESSRRAQCIVNSLFDLCEQLGIDLLAECIETEAEYAALRRAGVRLMQGYLFAKPGFECLPDVSWPGDVDADATGTSGVRRESVASQPSAA